MAILKTQEKQQELLDGLAIIDVAKELGVPFSCHAGICGTCRIEVIEGMEHLNEKTEEEINLDCRGQERQACQCQIKGGVVTIKY